MFGENNELRDFLFYSYFGITYDSANKNQGKTLKACFDRAYLDLCRTIRFKGEHDTFKDNVKAVITKSIDGLISVHSQKDFDRKHEDICKEIITCANSQKVLAEDFTYGQAQKWLNMTLKYMLLIGFWNDDLKEIIGFLHVPVDSFIISAAKKDLGISITSKAWSKWDIELYEKFQKEIREKSSNENPIEWEHRVWLETAEQKKTR